MDKDQELVSKYEDIYARELFALQRQYVHMKTQKEIEKEHLQKKIYETVILFAAIAAIATGIAAFNESFFLSDKPLYLSFIIVVVIAVAELYYLEWAKKASISPVELCDEGQKKQIMIKQALLLPPDALVQYMNSADEKKKAETVRKIEAGEGIYESPRDFSAFKRIAEGAGYTIRVVSKNETGQENQRS